MKIKEVLGRELQAGALDIPAVGLDIGSRSSKGVLLRGDEIFTVVQPTGLYTQETADEILAELLRLAHLERKHIGRLVGTGYGRIALDYPDIPFEVITEIKCHGMGAHVAVPGARTIIDIGGQDSKAIKIDPESGKVLEFAMNDKCAAGTGRFLEKSAQTLGVELEEFGKLVAAAEKPSTVSSQCVVFAETEIITLRAKAEGLADGNAQNKSLADIAAGVHVSAARRVQNLLGRVGVQSDLVFTGGVSNNPGMHKVLEDLLGHKFTVPPIDLVLAGALGAAVFAAKAVAESVRFLPGQIGDRIETPAAPARPREPSFLEDLRTRIARSQTEYIKREDGRKRFAYQCNYAPLELLSAGGARHIRLFRAGDPETVARGERYTQSIYCDFSKSCLGFFSSGDPLYSAVDAVYNFYTCNTVKRVSEVLDRFVPVKLLNLPKLRNEPTSRDFFRLELLDMKRDIERQTGVAITDEALHNEIVKRNRLRRLLKEISELRKRPHPPLAGRDFLEIAKGYYYLEADEAAEAFERILKELRAKDIEQEGAGEALRIMISGSVLADGDRKVLDILEGEFGAVVVAEDVCTGLRPFYHQLREDGDPLDALVAGYLDQAPCARMKPLSDAAEFAAKLGQEYHADGVLYTYLKFCPTHSVGMKEYLSVFLRVGLPVLELSSDYSQSAEGQIRTRVEAFIEVLNDRRRQCQAGHEAALVR